MNSPIATGTITLVLPTYNERQNIDYLISKLYQADKKKQIRRVIFVDDNSPDGTSEYIKNQTFPLQVLCLHRIGRLGLSSAVVEGLLLSDTDYVAVMDADGQHTPADLMRMIETMEWRFLHSPTTISAHGDTGFRPLNDD